MNNIILTGFMGCGKTSVGKRLASLLDIAFLDTDELIEKEEGKSISDIFASDGEKAFRNMETECICRLLRQKKEPAVISVGGGLAVREENRRLLRELGTVVYLKVSPDTVYRRLKNDVKRPLLQGENPRGRIEDLMNARKECYEQGAEVVILADVKTFEEIMNEILSYCRRSEK